MEITPNKISGSPEELAEYFRRSGQTAPSASAPNMGDAINGLWIIIIGILSGALMVATALIDNPVIHYILFAITVLGIGTTSILILCKYDNYKAAGSVFIIMAVVFALILGVTKIENVSDNALDSFTSPKE